MRFIEHSLTKDKDQSMVQRSFLPFAATCLVSLVSDGGIVEGASTFELSNLTTYSTTEETEPVCSGKGPEQDALNCDMLYSTGSVTFFGRSHFYPTFILEKVVLYWDRDFCKIERSTFGSLF